MGYQNINLDTDTINSSSSDINSPINSSILENPSKFGILLKLIFFSRFIPKCLVVNSNILDLNPSNFGILLKKITISSRFIPKCLVVSTRNIFYQDLNLLIENPTSFKCANPPARSNSRFKFTE